MVKIFEFGQKIDQYDFKVINERDARASAGIMFLLGIVVLAYFLSTRNLFWANLFTITFIIEFVIRVFVNPIYAPYMIFGSLIVSNQEPEWVEAKPKKFAWILGVLLGAIMSYFILFDILVPARFLTCVLCLILLYLEAVFGICLGCIIYKWFNKKLYKCPGGICEVPQNKKNLLSKIIMSIFYISVFYGVFYSLKTYKYHNTTNSNLTQEQRDAMEFSQDNGVVTIDNNSSVQSAKDECKPPQWAIDIGHKDMWIEHHCNTKSK